MNKKIIYFVFFIFIFVISFFSMAKPVRGYKFGVPEITRDLKLEGESRVILYDEDEWDDHLGVGADNPDDFFGKYADVVGAKSKGKLVDWEECEIDFFADYILTVDVDVESIEEITDFNSVFGYIMDATNGLGDNESGFGAVVLLYEGVINSVLELGDLPMSAVVGNGSIATDFCRNYSMDQTYVNNKYGEKLDGTMVETRGWSRRIEGDFPDKPDSKGGGPFLADPHSWYDTYKKLKDLESELYYRSDLVVNSIYAFNDSFTYLRNEDFGLWNEINKTIATTLEDELGIPRPRLSEGGDNLPAVVLDAALNPTGENPIQEGTQALLAIREIIDEEIPEKFNFFYMLMMEGLPTYTPTDKYLATVIDDFDIDGEDYETNIGGLNPDLKVKGDVELDGTVITLKFEYEDGQVDPDNPDNELKDWEIVIAYSEQGAAGGKVFRDSKTGEVFYDTEGLGWLPDYEINIIVGICTLFSIGLIYAVLIRRKTEHKFLDKLRRKH